MNLVDLVNRKDRSVVQVAGNIETGISRSRGRKERVVRFEPASKIALDEVQEFSVLRAFPPNLNWSIVAAGWRSGGLRITLTDETGRFGAALLANVRTGFSNKWVPIVFSWPIWAGRSGHLGLTIEQTGKGAIALGIGPLLNPRSRILPLLKGDGVEVGPGLNPQVTPTEGVNVRYVEAMPAEHWMRLYKKKDAAAAKAVEPLWERYVIASAEHLDFTADSSLDFVFSNHVFEHFANPLGVLENWLRKLKPGGVIAGVVPDARFTFDLRQPWSTFEEIVAERERGGFEIEDSKYDKWCRYTAPYNKREDLITRRYSIHVHYYVPELFLTMADFLQSAGWTEGRFLETAPNNKDFGFALWKSVKRQTI